MLGLALPTCARATRAAPTTRIGLRARPPVKRRSRRCRIRSIEMMLRYRIQVLFMALALCACDKSEDFVHTGDMLDRSLPGDEDTATPRGGSSGKGGSTSGDGSAPSPFDGGRVPEGAT